MFYITEKNWNKVLGYAEEAYKTHKSEIGGMSVMVKDKDNDWELQYPAILQQEISAGNTVLDKDALAVYYTKQAKKMGKKDFRFCWWHSHHTMDAFWSSTDKTAIDEYSDGDFSFALVVNLKGEYKFRVSVWQPVQAHEDVDLEIVRHSRCNKNMAKEVENLCSKYSYVHSPAWNKHTANRSYSYRSINRTGHSAQEQIPFRSMGAEIDDFNRSYGTKMSFPEIVEEVDDISSEIIEGAIDYKEYSIRINDLNRKLKEEDSFYEVTLISESNIPNLVHMYPNQMVIYASSKEDVYDDSFYMGY